MHPKLEGVLLRLAALSLPALTSIDTLLPAGGCYVLSKACPNNQTEEVRKGEPLSDAEIAGVQAALDMLGKWEALCGVGGPPGSGGAPTSPKGTLEPMLNGGSICKEVKGDPRYVGATTSNPLTGNGLDAQGCTWSTEGHPGINIGAKGIPIADANGQFDPSSVATLAAHLIHEIQHLLNPNNAANSQKEYEVPAYKAAAKELCKVAGCAAASQAERDVACAAILDANKELCKYNEPQECCADCPNGGGPGPTGGGCIHCDYSSTPGPTLGAKFLDQTHDEIYAALLDVRGFISLDVLSQLVSFSLHDHNGKREFYFACYDPGLTFKATTFTQIGDTTILLGGFDSITEDGELVLMEFDPFVGQVVSSQSVLVSSAFVTVACMDKFPGATPRVAFLDHVSDSVFVYNYTQGALQQVANSAAASLLAEMKYLSVWERRAVSPPGGGPVPIPIPRFGYEIWVTSVSEKYQDVGVLIGPHMSIIDADGNGTFETIQ